jgi:hypothetical protein
VKRYLSIFAALAMSLMSSAFVPSLKAGDLDKRTIITISQPVTVEGAILPAGRYVLRLNNSGSVLILNAEETRLITTVLAIHTYRLQPTGKSEFSFYNMPAGQPAALHTWFYPGDPSGFEFRQPQRTVPVDSSFVAGN